ncbi:MAG: peptidase, partial [Maribacter sp.]
MTKLIIGIVGLAMACNSSQTTVPEKTTTLSSSAEITFAETITADELKEHLFIYASDEFEGRDTGSPGQKKAAAYIKNEYVSMGIPAAKEDGDYYQEVPMEIAKMPSGVLSINGEDY